MIMIRELADEFRSRFNTEPLIFSAPGRVNLIGEHTDYNEGFVLPFAIDERTYVLCSRRQDRTIRAYTRTLDRETSFQIDEMAPSDGWARYLVGITTVLQRKGIKIDGADLMIDSEIPFGAGLSSSAALEIASGLALTRMAGVEIEKVDLAFAGQTVEHEFLGVRSGIMDQFASALSLKDHCLLIDCRSFERENIPLQLDDLLLVVCDSRVKHELAGTEYNRRREECELGVQAIRGRFPDVRSLRDVSITQLEESEADMPPVFYRRCRHVISENRRTLDAVAALRERAFERLGQLMYSSHESLRDDYEVSCAELDLLVETAAGTEGVLGSRMTGGGFGGCTINLVHRDTADEFSDRITNRFLAAFDHAPEIFWVRPSDGAREERS